METMVLKFKNRFFKKKKKKKRTAFVEVGFLKNSILS